MRNYLKDIISSRKKKLLKFIVKNIFFHSKSKTLLLNYSLPLSSCINQLLFSKCNQYPVKLESFPSKSMALRNIIKVTSDTRREVSSFDINPQKYFPVLI